MRFWIVLYNRQPARSGTKCRPGRLFATRSHYSYDANGYVASVTDPLSHSRTFTYDALGHKLSESAVNYTSSYAYDALGRLTSATAPGGRATSFAYDAAGNKTGVTNALGQTDTITYNAVNQVTSHTDALGRTVGYGYDAVGNRITFTDGRGKVTTYSYNGRGERTGIAYADGTSDAYAYNAVGELVTKTDGRGVITTLSYDDAGRLTGRTSPQGTVTYTYDAAGRLVSVLDRGDTVAYAYDSLNRLTTTNLPDGTIETKTYDVTTGDLLQILTAKGAAMVSSFGYTYDDANKLLSAGAKSYTYDAADNTKTVTTGGQVTTLSWNGEGMLTGIAYPGGATDTFTYNGLMQRVGKTDSTGTFAYTLTDDAIDSAVLSDGAAVYRQGLGLLGEVRGGDKRYYNADSLGSTRTIADGAGNISATRETDAFGNTVAQTGTQTPFGFARQYGYQADADSQRTTREKMEYYVPSIALGLFFACSIYHAVLNATKGSAKSLVVVRDLFLLFLSTVWLASSAGAFFKFLPHDSVAAYRDIIYTPFVAGLIAILCYVPWCIADLFVPKHKTMPYPPVRTINLYLLVIGAGCGVWSYVVTNPL